MCLVNKRRPRASGGSPDACLAGLLDWESSPRERGFSTAGGLKPRPLLGSFVWISGRTR